MGRWAVVAADGTVENLVVWDGVTEWSPPDGSRVVAADGRADLTIGCTVDDKDDVVAEAPPVVLPSDPTADAIAALEAKVAVLEAAKIEVIP